MFDLISVNAIGPAFPTILRKESFSFFAAEQDDCAALRFLLFPDFYRMKSSR